MLLLICLLAVLVLLLAFEYRWRNWKLIKLSEQLKSDTPCWPLVGHAYKCIGNEEDHMNSLKHFGREAIKHGGLTSVWLGHMLFIVIADTADAEFILKNYLEKGFVMNFAREVIGNGNIVAPVPIWRLRRKILIRAFSPKNLKAFDKIFAKNSRIMVQKLETRVGTGPFPTWKYFNTYTLDIISETTLGEDLDTTRRNKLIEMIESGFKLVADRMLSPWQYNSTLFKLFPSYYTSQKIKTYIDEFFSKTVPEKRRILQKNTEINKNIKGDVKPQSIKSFMELLIEANVDDRQYTDKEVQEEVLVIFMAGSDTTATGLAFATLMLARHPDIQEKVYLELKDMLGDSTRLVTTEDLMKLKFLDAIVKETLRLYSPVPVIARHSGRELTLPSGVSIASNCHLLVNIWALHRNPNYWGPDAEKFKPERWLDDTFNLKHPAQYMPFSYGPRNCVGYKFAMTATKMMLATMLRRYRVFSETTTHAVHKPLRIKFALTMKDCDDFIILLEKRI